MAGRLGAGAADAPTLAQYAAASKGRRYANEYQVHNPIYSSSSA